MNKGVFSAGAIFAFAAMSLAQVSMEPAAANPAAQAEAPKAQASSAPANALASGTLLSVELSKPLDARKSKPNDRIEARTATDILAHGQIVLSRNTKIIGHITQAKARSKTSPDSTLGITFDHIRLKDGSEVPLPVVVQAIARPLQFGSSAEVNLPTRPGLPPGVSGRPQLGDASPSGVPTYPGDLATPPDPMPQNTSTVIALSPTSRGVVGMKGLSLETSGPVSVLSSNSGNVHLDTGTQLILLVQ